MCSSITAWKTSATTRIFRAGAVDSSSADLQVCLLVPIEITTINAESLSARIVLSGSVRLQADQAGAAKRLSRVVRKRGFEPLRYCYRQPLKLVRLPVPPLPRGERRYFESRQRLPTRRL